MALLQVRNFPEEEYEILAQMAKMQNRSIAQQTVYILHNAIMEELENSKLNRKKAINSALMAAENIPEYKAIPPVQKFIREDRDR